MAWMLCEELSKWIVLITAGYLLRGMKGAMTYMITKKCVIDGCMRVGSKDKRGLCMICYGKAKRKVESGETNWERLTELGLCGEESSPFDDAYSRAMKDN